MYSKQEVSQVRTKFWTSFGQYMRPVKGAYGDTVNWLNYKTGVRHIYFRMDVTSSQASIAIELQHPDRELRHLYFDQFAQLKKLLENACEEQWDWEQDFIEEHGKEISRIRKTLNDVNIFKEDDWPQIISFLKPRILALDQFWMDVRDRFE